MVRSQNWRLNTSTCIQIYFYNELFHCPRKQVYIGEKRFWLSFWTIKNKTLLKRGPSKRSKFFSFNNWPQLKIKMKNNDWSAQSIHLKTRQSRNAVSGLSGQWHKTVLNQKAWQKIMLSPWLKLYPQHTSHYSQAIQ